MFYFKYRQTYLNTSAINRAHKKKQRKKEKIETKRTQSNEISDGEQIAICTTQCVNTVGIRSYSGPHFSRILPNSDRIRRDYLSVFSPNTGKWGKNAEQNNSEYGHFLHSDETRLFTAFICNKKRVHEVFLKAKLQIM